MNDTDTAQVIIRRRLPGRLPSLPGFRSTGSSPCPSCRTICPQGWIGAMVFVFALGLGVWALDTVTGAGSNVPTNRPTTTIVESGPYRFTRNPIYMGMFGG